MKNILVKKSYFSEDDFNAAERYKKAVLLAYLCLLIIVVYIAYIFIDASVGFFETIPLYLFGMLGCLIAFFANRYGKVKLAITIFCSVVLALLYVFTDNDLTKLGANLYSLVFAIAALSLYGYQNFRWGLLFTLLTFACFYVAYFIQLPHVVEPQPFPLELKDTYFFFNFTIALLVATILVGNLIFINYTKSKELWNKNKELAQVNNELDRFVYSASHDLKAPLNSLKGLVELGERSNEVTEIKTYLKLMKTRITDQELFIHEIIDFSRNAKSEIVLAKVNLLELMEEIIESLHYAEGMTKVQVTYNVPREFSVIADRSRMKIILQNIIGNAMRYHDPSQANPWVKLKAYQQSTKLIIEVEDNGVGIPQENQAKIFDMFFRGTDKVKGSGLGLFIVKETVEKLGGKIELSSQLGKGSIFKIELPSASAIV